MAIVKVNGANFLASEVSLVLKTHTFLASTIGAVNEVLPDGTTHKILKAGTVYPANDATAEGIVYEDVDLTNGDKAGSLMVAGHYLSNKVSVSTTAKEVFVAQGLFGKEEPTNTFPADNLE
jgi:hypothetical protein